MAIVIVYDDKVQIIKDDMTTEYVYTKDVAIYRDGIYYPVKDVELEIVISEDE